MLVIMENDRIRLYSISFESVHGYKVDGFLASPCQDKTGKYPVIIFVRGGNREFGKLDPAVLCRFAEKGYMTAGIDYDAENDGFGGKDLDDIERLIDIVSEYPNADPDAIYMAGFSRGGMEIYMICRKDPRIKAAAVCGAPSDAFDLYDRIFHGSHDMRPVMETLIGGDPVEEREEYLKRTAVFWADEIKCPVLICHNIRDDRVGVGHAVQMDKALTEAGKEHFTILYDKTGHSLKGTGAFDEIVNWFSAHMGR